MFMVELFSNYFFEVATASVTLIVPIISLAIVFKIVGDLLWK